MWWVLVVELFKLIESSRAETLGSEHGTKLASEALYPIPTEVIYLPPDDRGIFVIYCCVSFGVVIAAAGVAFMLVRKSQAANKHRNIGHS